MGRVVASVAGRVPVRGEVGNGATDEACAKGGLVAVVVEHTGVEAPVTRLAGRTGQGTVAAVVMQKGGVGKTTCTICAARAARVYHEARVLVVDFDPQGNTTSTLARDEVLPDQLTIADVVLPEPDASIDEVIVPTVWDGVDLAPGGITLAAAEKRILASEHGREHRLRKALAPALGEYDLVLIDNAPALGMLLVNALTASDKVLFVVQADQWSADGLALLRTTLDGVIEYSNPRLEIAGTIVNQWRHTGSHQELAEEITTGMARHFPGVPVWLDRKIPLWQGIPDHVLAGKGLDEGPTKLRVLAKDTFQPITAELLGRQVAA
jgi:chromosome partitioning protein